MILHDYFENFPTLYPQPLLRAFPDVLPEEFDPGEFIDSCEDFYLSFYGRFDHVVTKRRYREYRRLRRTTSSHTHIVAIIIQIC